jgi:transcription elongation factor Elf1
LQAIGVESTRPYVFPVLDVGSTMATLTAIVHCPRCRSRPTVQSAVALRPGVEYLTLRCASCGLLYDGQVPSEPKKVSVPGEAKPSLG